MLRKVLDNGVEWLCLVLMAVLAFDLMLGVFSRYVLFSTFTWYDEIARACFSFLPIRAELDLMGWGDEADIFSH